MLLKLVTLKCSKMNVNIILKTKITIKLIFRVTISKGQFFWRYLFRAQFSRGAIFSVFPGGIFPDTIKIIPFYYSLFTSHVQYS